MSDLQTRFDDYSAAAPAAFRPPPLPVLTQRGRQRRARRIVAGTGLLATAAAIATVLMLTFTLAPALPDPPPVADTITAVDWTRTEIVLPANDDNRCPQGKVRLHPRDSVYLGHIGQTADSPWFAVLPGEVYGDLTGDGQPEAILPIRCVGTQPDGMMPEEGSQLLVVQQLADHSLVGLGYVGVINAQYPTYKVDDNRLYVKLRYHHSSANSFGFSYLDTGFTQVWQWDGAAFHRIGGRAGNLNYSGQKASSGSPIRLATIMRGDAVACPGGVVTFGLEPTTIDGHTINSGGDYGIGDGVTEIVTDLNGDGDDELIVPIGCAGATYPASASVYVLAQGETMFVPQDVPFANDGRYDLDGLALSPNGHTLTITLTDRATQASTTYTLTWNGQRFQPAIGTFRR